MPDSPSGMYKLSARRTVSLMRLSVTLTYSGVLEGTASTASTFIRASLAQDVAQSIPPGKPLVVVDDRSTELPRFRWIAEFYSARGITTNDPDYSSKLFVCWFSDEIPDALHSAIAQVLAKVQWDANAEEYDLTAW